MREEKHTMPTYQSVEREQENSELNIEELKSKKSKKKQEEYRSYLES